MRNFSAAFLSAFVGPDEAAVEGAFFSALKATRSLAFSPAVAPAYHETIAATKKPSNKTACRSTDERTLRAAVSCTVIDAYLATF
jgi:hypothetical protein